MTKVGFFGGTYDPIHCGHVNFAKWALEKADLDEILFCPANHSPEKIDRLPCASSDDRLEMIRLAIEEEARFLVTDVELRRPGPSYTIDTIRELKKARPEDQFFLLLGKHITERIETWKEAGALLALAEPIIAIRPGGSPPEVALPFRSAIAKGILEIPPIEVSSTEVREKLARGESIEGLVPPKVLDYIKARRVYC